MPNKETVQAFLTDNERDAVKKIAAAWGITEEDAASRLTSDALARRIKRNTGKTPAKVYSIRKH